MSGRPGAVSVVIGLTAAGLIGCGAGPAATAGSPGVIVTIPASPAASPPGGGAGGGTQRRHRFLTVTDDGALVRLRAGQAVTVVLSAGGLRWDIPRAAGAAVRRISGTGGYPGRRAAVAVFRAARPGRSWLTSFTDAPCLHTQPRCGMPQRLWRALVIVVNS